MDGRAVLLALAATPGALPAVTAARLAAGQAAAELLGPGSPEPGLVGRRLDALGASFLTPLDPDWPLLATPPDPPCAWLFAAGRHPPPAGTSVAIVGGRRATPLRAAVARSLASGLAAAGWTVVSGGAVGVDAAAHQGALDAGGTTVAVLGCGLDVAYPRANQALLARVRAEGGTLLSEHPPGARPLPANFVPRNRLIAALAAAVVVVEAASASGSLSTARAAGSRGRGRVLVVPGAPWDPGAAGCNELIRDGATLVRGIDDVLAELGAPPAGPERQAPPRAPANAPPAGSAAAKVLELLIDGFPVPMRTIAAVSGLAPDELARALTELELRGLARRSAAGVQSLYAFR